MKKLNKLDINLITSESEYLKDKTNYIANYPERYVSGFWGGNMVPQLEVAEARWNEKYPNGYDDWKLHAKVLNSYGQQRVIDKINELIDLVNKIQAMNNKNYEQTRTQ